MKTRPHILLPLILAFGLSTAHAASKLNAEASFPLLPCADGWTSCIVSGLGLNSDMIPDSKGVPQPSDIRIGWFDLKGTLALSPFTTLSDYSRTPAPAVAAIPRADPVPLPVSGQQPTQLVERPGTLPSLANRDPAAPPSAAEPVGTSPTLAPIYVPPAPGNPYNPTPQEPPPVLVETPTPAQPEPTPIETTPPPQVPVVAEAPPTQDDSCDNLIALEPTALMGQLSPGQRECLEGRLSSATRPTEKDKISRVLLTDADARSDRGRWMALAKRHLEDIDRSDPDLCMTYATRLAGQGVSRAHGVIRWADYALENKQKWSGATFTSRVNALYKLRAEAANRLWSDADKKYVENRTSENEESATKYRNMTKDYSREWLDYARASGQNIKNAYALCVSAAGNKSYCEGG